MRLDVRRPCRSSSASSTRLRRDAVVDDHGQVAADDRLSGDRPRRRAPAARCSAARSSSNTTGARGSSKLPDQPRMQLADPAGVRAVDEHPRATRPGCSAGCVGALGRQPPRRGQRFEVALDVEEVDARAPACCPIAPAARRRTRARRRAAAARLRRRALRGYTRPISNRRTRLSRRLTLVRSASISPGSSVRAHHVELRGDRVQHADRRAPPDRARASTATSTKPNVTISCQSRADQPLAQRLRADGCASGTRQHVL